MNFRSIRKSWARYLPERVKRGLRGRLYGYARTPVSFDVQFEPDHTGRLLTTVNGSVRFKVDADDRPHVAYHFEENGASMEEVYGFLQHASTATTLFDVGSHIGLFSLMFCAAKAGNRAVAYEPVDRLADKAERLAAMNGFSDVITVRRLAIGEAEGTLSGFLHETGMLQSLGGENLQSQTGIKQTTLDAEVAIRGIPDIVKIDVEGYEHEVLRGAGQLLRSKPVLFLEFHLDILERRSIDPRILTETLRSAGYDFYSCLGKPLAPHDISQSMNAIIRVIAK
jgi:FkbM family methyltransferase